MVISFISSSHPLSVVATEVLETLIDWAVEGLDLSAAIAQPETAYKVRHLKMGVRLSGALCCCNSDITVQLMVSISICCHYMQLVLYILLFQCVMFRISVFCFALDSIIQLLMKFYIFHYFLVLPLISL